MSSDSAARPYRTKSIFELESIVERVRDELAHRSASAARGLREEIDPEFSIERPRQCCVYVIELEKAVLTERRFIKQNPTMRRDRPFLYVGSTWRTPEERYQEHKEGGRKASAGPHRYGTGLRPEFYELLPQMTREEAEMMEQQLAELLRREGYGVWQG